MRLLAQFGRFWYDFIVGDDWTIAVAVVIAVAVTAVLAHRGWNVWPIVPVGVTLILAVSCRREARARRRREQSAG